jgi:hypothetical protein
MMNKTEFTQALPRAGLQRRMGRKLAWLLGATALLIAGPLQADTICAKVKIEIVQKLTMERQAFDATMKITNGLTTNSLDNVNISVNFADEAGNSVKATSDPTDTTASFFIRIDTMTGINDVNGNGSIAASTAAEIHWLIIPAPGAGGTVPSGKLYYIGADLSYNIAGQAESLKVSPDFVYVAPMPLLTLDYFMTKDVWGDDPLTPEIEPIEPYTLGVRIKNTGAATAKNVAIDSAQPKIVENLKGLEIAFKIIGSYLNDQPTIPTLTIPFGDIAANTASSGRWLMTSTLAGHFDSFTATFTHADSLGGAVTSLLQATNAHFLIHDVKVDLPGRDNVRDFLALDGNVLRVYESSGLDTLVTDQSVYSALVPNGSTYALSAPATGGLMYIQLPDPTNGTMALGLITRADGKTMPVENVWLSKKRDDQLVLHYYFNLFDSNSPGGIYTTTFINQVPVNHPPVIVPVPDSTTTEGKALSFTVSTYDPEGTLPILTSSALPTGATFSTVADSHNNVTGTFSWTPVKGQAGKYPITFTSTDGVLITSLTGNVTVTTPIIPAGPDVPEIANPKTDSSVGVRNPVLAIAPSANALDIATSYHIQVFSDASMQNMVAEKLSLLRVAGANTAWQLPQNLADNTRYYWRVQASDGTNFSSWTVGRFFINTANDAPTAPAISMPVNGTTVAVTTPELSVMNSTDADGDAVVYGFEVYADSLLTQKVAEIANLPAGANGTTAWMVSSALSDMTQYYWRAYATDIYGAKTVSRVGSFIVDLSKPVPVAPSLISPPAGSVLTVNSVALTVGNSLHAGGTTLSYYYELDRVPTFNGPDIIRSGAVLEGSANTAFSLSGLVENAHYYWRVKVSDGLTSSAWTYGDFTVDTVNDAPGVFEAINPADKGWVTTTMPMFSVAPAIDPEGDAVNYHIEVYSDVTLTTKVADHLVNTLFWLIDTPLQDDTTYYWRARAEDARGGLSAWSKTSAFHVRVGSSGSTLPLLALTSPAGVVTVNNATAGAVTTVDINWEMDDVLNNSTLSLFYSSDPASTSGTTIISGLAQNPNSRTGSFTWDVSTMLPGTYYIYAVASNSAGSVTRSAPGAFVVSTPQQHGVISITPVGLQETTEAGGQASFKVALGNSPKGDVVIGLNATNQLEARVDPQQLVFNASNWNVAQTVTVTGLPDCINDGDITYQVITAKSVSTDVDYNTLKALDLTLSNRNSTVGCPSNLPPVAQAGPAQSVAGGTAVTLPGSGSDADGTVVSYAWTQTAGPTVILGDASSAVTGFTAPLLGTDTAFTFQLLVTDNLGATGTASVTVTVKAIPNVPPTANAGPTQNVATGATVTLAGSGTDTDGTVSGYAWSQIAGPTVVLANANVASTIFVAPLVTMSTVLGFQLTVTDNAGATGTSTVIITVAPNQAPTANAGTNQTVNEAVAVTLSGSGADTDGTIASYAWMQTAGPTVTLTNANTAIASFTAPAVSADTELTFTLTVTDNQGATGSASSNVTVKHVNLAPTANAGVNQSVNENTLVTLSGSGTDIDGTIATYAWTQTAGPAVTLANSAAAVTTFTTPATLVDTVLTFKLTVTDNLGATGSALTNVTMQHVNVAPTANAGANQTVNEASAVTLTGTGTDSDGTIASYAWVQTSGTNVTLTNANTAVANFTAPATLVDSVLVFQLTVTDNLGAKGTASSNITVKHVNVLPTATAGANQTVNEASAVTLSGTGTDTDGTITSYAWVQTSGPNVTLTNANAAVASFTAPATLADAVLTFTLTVTDNAGATGTASSSVTVKHVNVAPTASAGADQTANEGISVTLTGSGADTDGTIASYAWTQTAGPTVTLTNANAVTASFTAPATLVDVVLTFKLTVTDNSGATGMASSNVTVKHVNVAPTANAGANQTVADGSAVTLSGTGLDTDGTIASYAWTQTAGPSVTLTSPAAASTSFTAPALLADTILTFKLTVTDNLGATGTALTNVIVSHGNIAPIANAGANQTVNAGSAVTLAGSGTDSDGTIASYAWTQTSGPSVVLSNATAASAGFTAPAVSADTVFAFQLTVTDNLGATGTATTSVTVKHANVAPTANAGANQTMNAGAAVTLAGSGTDADGTIASYAWTQTSGPSVAIVNGNAATASFVAPVVLADSVLTFQLTVTDNLGATGTAGTSVTVLHGNIAPTANAGVDQTVNEGDAVTFAGSGADVDGTIASYLWTQTAGPTVNIRSAKTATAGFKAPKVAADTVFTFQLTVTDNLGASGTAITNVIVKNVNVPPVAKAGGNQKVNEGDPVTLTGSGKDKDGTIVSYAWTQTAGPAATLTNDNTDVTSFIAPATPVDAVLTFMLTVTDDSGATATASTNVTVKHVNVPPTANAGADQSVTQGSVTTLSGSGTDVDGTIVAYAWTQTAGPKAKLSNAKTATATFTAPKVTVSTVLTFELTVKDDSRAKSTATTNVTVN